MQESEASLDRISETYKSDQGLELLLLEADIDVILGRLSGKRVLELGCANGVMTRVLAEQSLKVDVVEGSANYISYVRGLVGERVTFYHSLFEDFEPEHFYDDIILASVLEHVEDPVGLVQNASNWLEPRGRIHVIVPNAMSLHRRLGVEMGMLSDVTQLTEADVSIGHQRIYTQETLDRDLAAVGLVVLERRGILLKPLSNIQMDIWPTYVLDELFRAGELVPNWAAHMYRLCGISSRGEML